MGKPTNFSNPTPIALHHLKLRPLLIFDRVLNSPSIAGAARELNMSQSAVTKAIQELEKSLGVALFERSNKGVAPTCYAAVVSERLRAVKSSLRHLADELNAFRSGSSGQVIVGTLIAASAELLPRAILKLKRDCPGILVTVREGSNEQLFHGLANGELDIVVGRLPEPHLPLMQQYPLQHTLLYEDTICAVAGKHHPLARSQPKNRQKSPSRSRSNPQGQSRPTLLPLARLGDYPWILPLRTSPARATLERCLHEQGLRPPADLTESLSIVTNIGLLQGSDAVMFMPLTAARHYARLGLLGLLNVPPIGSFGQVGYSVKADYTLPPATQLFIRCLG